MKTVYAVRAIPARNAEGAVRADVLADGTDPTDVVFRDGSACGQVRGRAGLRRTLDCYTEPRLRRYETAWRRCAADADAQGRPVVAAKSEPRDFVQHRPASMVNDHAPAPRRDQGLAANDGYRSARASG